MREFSSKVRDAMVEEVYKVIGTITVWEAEEIVDMFIDDLND